MTQTYKAKRLKKLSGIAALLLTVVFWAGCQSSPSTENTTPGNEKSGLVTSSGVKAEVFLPKDTMIVFKAGTNSESQLQNLDTLKKNFPAEMWAAWDKNLNQMLENMGDGANVSIKEDVLPAFGKNPQILVGLNSLPSNFQSSNTTPEVTVIATVENKEPLAKLLDEKVSETEKKTYKEWTIYNPNNKTYVALTNDVALLTTSEEGMQKALDSSVSEGQTSLLTNPRYQKVLSKTADENIFYYYIDVPAYSKAIVETMREASKQAAKQNPEAPQAKMDEKALEKFQEYLNAMDGEIISGTAEDKGIRLHGYASYDKAKMQAAGYDFEKMYQPAYLYKKVPGDNMIMYTEASNLKEMIGIMQKSLAISMSTYPGMEADLEQMSNQINSFFSSQGLDVDKDILSFMDKGFALAFQSNNDVTKYFPMPSIGVYIDASSNPEGAKKTMQKLYEMLNLLIAQGKMAQPQIADVLSHENYDNDKGVYYGLKVDLQKLPEEQKKVAPSQELLNMPIEAYYGVRKDNLAFFSFFYPKFDQNNYETLDKNSSFTQAMNDIKGYENSIVYFDMPALVKYVDSYIEMMVKLGGIQSVPAEYTTFKAWVSPIKTMIFSSAKPSDNEMSMEGFIRIEK